MSKTLGLRYANPLSFERLYATIASYVNQDVSTTASPSFKSITVDALTLTKGGSVTELESNAVLVKSNYLKLQDIDDSTDNLADTTGILFHPDGASLYYDISDNTFHLKKSSSPSNSSPGNILLTLSSSTPPSSPINSAGSLVVFDTNDTLRATTSLDFPFSFRNGLTVSNDYLNVTYGVIFSNGGGSNNNNGSNGSIQPQFSLDVDPISHHLDLKCLTSSSSSIPLISWSADGMTLIQTPLEFHNGTLLYDQGSDFIVDTPSNQGTVFLTSEQSALNGGALATIGGMYCGTSLVFGDAQTPTGIGIVHPSYNVECNSTIMTVQNVNSTLPNLTADTLISLQSPNGSQSGWLMQAGPISSTIQYQLTADLSGELRLQANKPSNSSNPSKWQIDIDEVTFNGNVNLNNILQEQSTLAIVASAQVNCSSVSVSPNTFFTRLQANLGCLTLKVKIEGMQTESMVYFKFDLPSAVPFPSMASQQDLVYTTNGSIYHIDGYAIVPIYDTLVEPIASTSSAMVSFTPFHGAMNQVNQTVAYVTLILYFPIQ